MHTKHFYTRPAPLLSLVVALALLVPGGTRPISWATEREAAIAVNRPTAPADSLNVELVGQIGGASYAVAADGNYAYVGIGPSLVILDVSNPAQPARVGQAFLSRFLLGVAVAGSYAYVADFDSGLRVINIANPAAPVEVGFYDTPGWAYGVAVAGGYAYVADYDYGLAILRFTGQEPVFYLPLITR